MPEDQSVFPGALDDLLVKRQQRPSLRHSIESRLPVNGVRFRQLVEHDRYRALAAEEHWGRVLRAALASLALMAGVVILFAANQRFVAASPGGNDFLVHWVGTRALLVSNYGVKRVIKRRKASASIPAPDEVVRELADECDLVITGSGD